MTLVIKCLRVSSTFKTLSQAPSYVLCDSYASDKAVVIFPSFWGKQNYNGTPKDKAK